MDSWRSTSTGLSQLATEDFNETIRLDPQYTEAYVKRGFAHLNLGEIEAATGDYSEAIRLDPQHADAYAGRALATLPLARIWRPMRMESGRRSWESTRGHAANTRRDHRDSLRASRT
ncbi:MAG: tetratricopeptide repeat protein [SAR202 cluster bacterium]|nr:tetratricopeptide repeat protein [SAR202 cluster bacterium]MDP6662902.1 tetratricopeptide repeat protein [SAR202 cluster bacterium]MDP6801336.1 tetratricopeptide repeat protein [SAR202 cluster bacterium]